MFLTVFEKKIVIQACKVLDMLQITPQCWLGAFYMVSVCTLLKGQYILPQVVCLDC